MPLGHLQRSSVERGLTTPEANIPAGSVGTAPRQSAAMPSRGPCSLGSFWARRCLALSRHPAPLRQLPPTRRWREAEEVDGEEEEDGSRRRRGSICRRRRPHLDLQLPPLDPPLLLPPRSPPPPWPRSAAAAAA